MDCKDIISIQSILKTLNYEKLIITGGEPFLRKDIFDVIEVFYQNKPSLNSLICVNTNGSKITKSVSKNLVNLVDQVRVSIDGMKNENDRLRGIGSFKSAINAIKNLQIVGFEPVPIITLTKENYKNSINFLKYLKAMGIKEAKFNIFKPIGKGKNQKNLILTEDSIKRLVEDINKLIYKGNIVLKRKNQISKNCGIGSYINILCNGDIYPCHALVNKKFYLGNIKENNIRRIFLKDGILGKYQCRNNREIIKNKIKIIDDNIYYNVKYDGCIGLGDILQNIK